MYLHMKRRETETRELAYMSGGWQIKICRVEQQARKSKSDAVIFSLIFDWYVGN